MKLFNVLIPILVMVLLSTLFSSCDELITETDPCEDVVCLNGGYCQDGTCICTNGYTGTNCQTAPPDPCEVNNTAQMCIENASTTGKTYDIILNGVKIMTLAVGESQCTTVTAGQEHTVRALITNTNNKACDTASPVIPQCGTRTYKCSV